MVAQHRKQQCSPPDVVEGFLILGVLMLGVLMLGDVPYTWTVVLDVFIYSSIKYTNQTERRTDIYR